MTEAVVRALLPIVLLIGLDPAALRNEMESDATLAVIRDNHELAAALEINGTPTFIIKETMVRGYVPLDGMRQIVAGQRRKD